jgi:hypothetical protein
MIAHVAEASEGSGRVLFWLDPDALTPPAAIHGATRLAAAFGSEIETLVVEDGAVARAKALPVARTVGHLRNFAGSLEDAGKSLALLGQRQRREVEDAAAALGIPCHHTITAGDAIDQLTGLCLMSGPWNVIAMSQEPTPGMAMTISAIMANVSGATGVVVSSRTPNRLEGPIAIVAEDAQRLPSMIRAAERLRTKGGAIHVFLAAETLTEMVELEGHVRLSVANQDRLVFETPMPTYAIEGTLDEPLRRLKPGYVIARFGGTLLPTPRALARTVALTGAPFLLVR